MMTLAMKPWLPETALEQCSPEPLLLRVIEQWSDHWLVNASPSLAAVFQDDWPLSSTSLKWRSGTAQAIAFREPAVALVSAMLGSAISPASLQPTDRRIIDELSTTAIDDLLRRIGDLCGTSEQALTSSPIDPGNCGWWEISLAPGKPAFKLAISKSALVRLIKGDLPAVGKPILERVSAGLAKQDVRIGTSLGRCNISLADLKGLGIGDVLVLDRLTDARVDFSVDGQPSQLRGSLDQVDGRAVLIVAPKERTHV